ncbi:TrkA C-terminal domain-containing protein [Aneurinibacillus tyrosinisolvens]|uniref:TrkA C-terminal domain-containing protein n=1 Tax=Aneurinibacillus tyrosinisolvens TaxID=1443435 RepID=UPI00063F4DDC|nr:TrkA C-terminal domain-containing protein [Aneurinibacillus tyrosinisolvens]
MERIDIEFVFILIYFVIVGLVIEISTVLLRLTGLEKEIARFQAISMLTGTGFTTVESELIARHPVRRKLATFLILFGAFSLAVIISSMSTILAKHSGIPQLSIIGIVLLVSLFVMKSKAVQERLERKMHTHMEKVNLTHELPVEDVLLMAEDDLLTDVHIFQDSGFVGKRVKECLREGKDLNILLVKRGDEILRENLLKAEVQEGDVLLVYGKKDVIEEVFADELDRTNKMAEDEQKTNEVL